MHRFANRPVRLPDGLHWNLLALFAETVAGLRALDGPLRRRRRRRVGCRLRAARRAQPRARPAVPLPRRTHRRHGRARARAGARATSCTPPPASRRCRSTRSSSCWPTRAARRSRRRADRPGARPDRPLAQRRAGQRDHERVDHRAARRPVRDLGARADRAARPAGARRSRGDPVEPGHHAGPHARPPRRSTRRSHAVASHDTASAFVAAPLRSPRSAILSSGTWSLLGRGARRARPHRRRRASSTSPTSAASTARPGCCAT